MAEIESLVNSRNEARGPLLAAVDQFLTDVDKLPINERLDKLKVCSEDIFRILHTIMVFLIFSVFILCPSPFILYQIISDVLSEVQRTNPRTFLCLKYHQNISAKIYQHHLKYH